ncbi:MAG: hypothetical protein AAFV80_05935 [Bacteroidota bacterium]
MKHVSLLMVFVFATLFAIAQDANKKYVKTLDPEESQNIILVFDHPAEAKEWQEDKMRILVDVTLKNGNETVLERLMLAGRYRVTSRKEGEKFIIDIPGLAKEVTVQGQPLQEDIKALVYVPKYTMVETKTQGALTQLVIAKQIDPELAARGLAAKFDPTFSPFDLEVNISYPEGNDDKSELQQEKADIDAQIKELREKSDKIENKLEKIDNKQEN